MRSHWNKSLSFLGSVALLLTLAGCFQSAGGDNAGFSVAQNAGPTFTPFPTDPPIVQEVIVTATPDPNAIFAEFPTQDPNSGFAIPTSDPNAGFVQPQDQQVALDPLEMTATFIVQQATDTAGIQLTQTAQAIFGIPTATEAPFLFATATPGTGTGGTVVSGNNCIHTVSATDANLYRISLNYNVTPQEIATASGLANMNLIYVGQELTIPNCGTSPVATSVPGGTGGTGGAVGQTYVVVQGDTLFKISQSFGVPVMSIANANGISNINLIVINQQLVIPPA